MRTYREHLHRLNRALAEEYILEHSHYVSMAIDELAKAVPVALAIAQFHDAIRRSPARNFWPVIRKARGTLFIRSTDTGPECPWPWQRTKSGNMRYQLAGHLLFSPWLPNFHRMVHGSIRGLQGLTDRIKVRASEKDIWVTVDADRIFGSVLGAKQLVSAIKPFQEFATPDSAALDRWSNEQQRGSIVLRISQGALVYSDSADRCEIEFPDTLSAPLCVPTVPVRFERHWIRAGDRAYL